MACSSSMSYADSEGPERMRRRAAQDTGPDAGIELYVWIQDICDTGIDDDGGLSALRFGALKPDIDKRIDRLGLIEVVQCDGKKGRRENPRFTIIINPEAKIRIQRP